MTKHTATEIHPDTQRADFSDTARHQLREILHEVAHLLPGQAPIGAFVHHNTLHVFEHMPFHQAVQHGHKLFQAEPYMSLSSFRQAFQQGRVTEADLDACLDDWLEEETQLTAGLTNRQLYRTALLHDLDDTDEALIRWQLEQGQLLDHFPPDLPEALQQALLQQAQRYLHVQLDQKDPTSVLTRFYAWEGASEFAEHVGCSLTPRSLQARLKTRPVPLLLRYLWGECVRLLEGNLRIGKSTVHTDQVDQSSSPTFNTLHPLLSRLAASYLDTGMAYWPMPNREAGFYVAVRELFQHSLRWAGSWIPQARESFTYQAQENMTAEEAVLLCLHQLQIPMSDWADRLQRELLALPGWTGMFWRLDSSPADRLRSFPYSLMDFLAVRLTLTLAIETDARQHPLLSSPAFESTDHASDVSSSLNSVHLLFRLFLYTGVSLEQASAMSENEAELLLNTLQTFDDFTRRAIFQDAFERHYRCEILDAVAAQAQRQRQNKPPTPKVQVAFCIDDREESVRRHLEEYGAHFETYGIAGFYGLAIAYKGLLDAHRAPLCPASQTPSHRISEVPEDPRQAAQWNRRWALAGQLGFAGYVGTKNMFRGFLFSLAGVLEAFPMMLRLLSPRLGHKIRTYFRERALQIPRTTLTSIRKHEHEHEHEHEHVGSEGFTPQEAVERIENVLRDMGLTSQFADLVVVLGHGSTSMNNPHEAAHECGACSGGKGGPNARLFADLINRAEVREGLRACGIDIPDRTVFIGGMHDTSNDAIDLYDLHRVPTSHHEILAETRKALDYARTMDAHERCRRFASVPLSVTPRRALLHVEGRAQDLAEPRPEYGHCTNSICLVGRRWLHRGLFLDRRAFLVSYDPTQDPDGAILERLLASVGPVGAGINLEYYFSYVDQERYGCGTKLPHNVTGLVGVINGHESDLRPGLPYQMVDIHEPMRLLTIVEATPERLLQIAERQPGVGQLVQNQWIQLVAMDPDTGQLSVFTSQGFQPYQPNLQIPEFPSSSQYYQGHRKHLAPARILSGLDGISHA